MSKYIDSEKLITEIEKQKKHLSESELDERGAIIAYDIVLRFIHALQQEQPGVDLKIEIGHWMDSLDDKYCSFIEEYSAQDIKETARHFYELGRNTRNSIWHNVAEEMPTKYGSEVIVACRNKNKEDGIWLYDSIQCWEGKWEPRVNWETPVKWVYVRDLDNTKNEE